MSFPRLTRWGGWFCFGVSLLTTAIWLAACKEAPLESEIGVVRMPFAGRFSAAVYDTEGQVVQRLYEAEELQAGNVHLTWDGADDLGRIAPGGHYTWRTLATQATIVQDGIIGNLGQPPLGPTNHSANVCAVAFDDAGNLYEASEFEEDGQKLRRWNSDGSPAWSVNRNFFRAVAIDSNFVYAARLVGEDKYWIERYTTVNGHLTNWPSGQLLTRGDRRHGAIHLAVDDARLWVSEFATGRVHVYDKRTGAAVSNFPVAAPRGLATDGTGHVWVACESNRVVRFSAAGRPTGAALDGLQNPWCVAVGGPSNHLYVAELATAQIREYDPVTLREAHPPRFNRAKPGPVDDFRFFWPTIGFATMDVGPSGKIVVGDWGSHRVLVYNAAGDKVLVTHFSDGSSVAPQVDPAVGEDIVLNGVKQYEVDHGGGATHGRWRLSHIWRPADGTRGRHGVGTHSWRRRLNGRDYLYFRTRGAASEGEDPAAAGFAIYDITGDQMRYSAALGKLTERGAGPHNFYLWRDTNGNGQRDEEDERSTGAAAVAGTFVTGSPQCIVDHAGTIWFPVWSGSHTVKLPVTGFDAAHNPVYDWQQAVIAVPRDETPWRFQAGQAVAIAPDNGRIFRLGATAFVRGGHNIDVSNSDGTRRNIMRVAARPLPVEVTREGIRGLTVTEDGAYFFTASNRADPLVEHFGGAFLRMHTADGLLIAIGYPSAHYPGGWFDSWGSIDAFTDPTTGVIYIYGEEIVNGSLYRYRVDHLERTVRREQSFDWTARPLVEWRAPRNREAVAADSPIRLEAVVVAPTNATITRVEFYQDANRLGEDASAPYECDWSVPSASAARHSLTALAHDSAGQIGRRSITVAVAPVAGLQVWLRADSLAGCRKGEPISNWSALVGEDRDARQPNPARMPTYRIDDATGQSLVRFDGIDDKMLMKVDVPETNYTYVAVFRTGQPAGVILHATYATGGDRFFGLWDRGRLTHRLWGDQAQGDVTADDDRWHWALVSVSATNGLAMYLDNRLVASDATLTGSPIHWQTHLVVGGQSRLGMFCGDLAELMVYDHPLTVKERMRLDEYFRTWTPARSDATRANAGSDQPGVRARRSGSIARSVHFRPRCFWN